MEWDQLLSYAAATLNWFLNEHSQSSPHCLYFGCDPYLPYLAALLQPKLRYLGSDEDLICLDKLWQVYMLAALNTKEACCKQIKNKYNDIPQYKIGDLVKIKNFDKKSNWDTKYISNFRIIRLISLWQLKVSNLTSRLWKVNSSDMHKILPSDFIMSSIPDEQFFSKKGK